MDAVIIFCSLSALLAIGKFLRLRVPLLQKLYLPSSVVGGLVGLIALSLLGNKIPGEISGGMRAVPGFLINIIFATLFLGAAVPKLKDVFRESFPQFCLGQIVAWGQYVVGLGLAGFVFSRWCGVPAAFGNLLEIGFEGGHGTVGGMAESFVSFGWEEGVALGYTVATVGMITGIVFGMALIQWALRHGYVGSVRAFDDRSLYERIGVHPRSRRPSAGVQTVVCDSIDSLAWHLAVVGIACLIGWGLRQLIPVEGFPLFPLCMLGGVLLSFFAKAVNVDLLVDKEQMNRISGAALDYLALAAVATIELSVVAANWIPLTIMTVAGVVWCVFSVMYFSPRLFKEAWFERGIAEFGQATGVTATGLLLLRTVDPDNKTVAAASFAGKQLLHEPGMNVWVALAFALVFTVGWMPVFLVSSAMLAIWLAVSVAIIRRNRKA